MQESCLICGAFKVLKPAGISKKTGLPFDAFLSCPNYRNHPAKGQPIPEYPDKPDINPQALIMDELGNITKGLRTIYKQNENIINLLKASKPILKDMSFGTPIEDTP